MTGSESVLLAGLLSIPRPDERLIERDRLAARLDESAAHRVISITAPAGFGKTSLVANWVNRWREGGGQVAWVSLDERHDNARTLLRYIVAALRTAAGAIGEATLTLLGSNVPMSAEALVTTFANELGGMNVDVHLVLDDCHHISDKDAREALALLLQHAPARLHFVLTSREAPPVPLGRLRQLGHLAELSPRELEFTPAEVASFADREQLDLGPSALAELTRKTGGWAAGLRLAAISLRDLPERERFIESLSGGHSVVADFLREDVLARQPDELQQFLLQSGLLDEFSAPMCDFVLARSDSRRMIEMTHRRGLFLFVTDPAGERFRYHRMFADFLRQRLQRDDPEAARAINRRASEWCAGRGSPPDAIDYALRAGDVETAGRQLETHCEQIFSSGQLDLLQSLAARLPDHVQDQCPRLQLDLIWIHTLRWEMREAVGRLRRVHEYVGAHRDPAAMTPELQEKILHRELMVALLRDDLSEAELLWSRWPLVATGNNSYFEGSAETADLLPRRERFECEFVLAQAPRVRRKFTNADAEFGTVWFDSIVGPAYLANGQALAARSVLEGAIETAVRISGSRSPLVAMPALLLADVLYEVNDLNAARDLVDNWLGQADRIGFVDQLVAGFVCAARIARLDDRSAQAYTVLDRGDAMADEYGFERLAVHLAGERIRQLLADNAVAQATSCANASAAIRDRPLAPPGRLATTSDLVAVIARARIAGAEREPARAVRVLRTWINYTEGRGCLRDAMRLRALLSVLLEQTGEQRESWRVLRPALELVRQTSLLRPLLDEGPTVTEMLGRARESHITDGDPLAPVVDDLCAAGAGVNVVFSGRRPQRATEAAGDQVLTARQREILEGVADGSSNKEVGARLGLTEATVKWHLQQVYERLGAHRRVAAVRRARELGLID